MFIIVSKICLNLKLWRNRIEYYNIWAPWCCKWESIFSFKRILHWIREKNVGKKHFRIFGFCFGKWEPALIFFDCQCLYKLPSIPCSNKTEPAEGNAECNDVGGKCGSKSINKFMNSNYRKAITSIEQKIHFQIDHRSYYNFVFVTGDMRENKEKERRTNKKNNESKLYSAIDVVVVIVVIVLISSLVFSLSLLFDSVYSFKDNHNEIVSIFNRLNSVL